MKSATLVLEDGPVTEGQAFGANADAVFELLFNTSMTDYQVALPAPPIVDKVCCLQSHTLAMRELIGMTMNRPSHRYRRRNSALRARTRIPGAKIQKPTTVR